MHDLPPEASAVRKACSWQRLAGAGLVGLALAAPCGVNWATVALLLGVGSLILAATLMRLTAALASPCHSPSLVDLPDADLPAYTILVPLYREAAVVPQLLEALAQLDYPPHLLQILLLVEAEDAATRAALARPLPSAITVLVMPPGAPRTKPRALVLALPLATGALLTVFDAEDIPDRNQLRRAAAAFAGAPDLGCLQAHLAIDNATDGWLAALFALEYAVLFDVMLPGLTRLRLPILLGGTSNHFRTATLRQVGGWDPWNVTEDADLGLRLARYHVPIATLPSTTREEAPARPKAWLRQRRRWMKGWMQTLIVHTRMPFRFVGELGALRAFAAAVVLANGLGGALLGLPLMIAFLRDVGMGAAQHVWIGTAVLGSLASGLPLCMAMSRRQLWHLWPVLWLAPLRWLLYTLAAWWALADLWLRPYHWGATRHGLARRPQPRLT